MSADNNNTPISITCGFMDAQWHVQQQRQGISQNYHKFWFKATDIFTENEIINTNLPEDLFAIYRPFSFANITKNLFDIFMFSGAASEETTEAGKIARYTAILSATFPDLQNYDIQSLYRNNQDTDTKTSLSQWFIVFEPITQRIIIVWDTFSAAPQFNTSQTIQ